MSIACTLAWIAALLILPLLILDWATCSRAERIRRLKAMGWSQARIANHLGVSRYQVRKALAS
jgi:DNA invertase Pin-like site-specific DNA recombinase